MKILALGATGAIGSQLIPNLVPAGHEIHVTSRRARPGEGNLRYIEGNARDDAFLRDLLRQDWDVIVDFMVYDTAGFRSRVDALLGACGQYIFTSTARVFAGAAGPDTPLITETSPRLLEVSRDAGFLASDEYALTKARQEDLLRGSGRGNWTILRPYITFGEGRLQLGTLEKEGWLYRALRGRSIVFCGPMLDRRTTLTDGADVARMIAVLVGNSAALGEDFNLTGTRSVTWRAVLDLYLDRLEQHLGHRPRVVLTDEPGFCRVNRAWPQIRYDRMYDRRFDPAKIGALFDLSSLTDSLAALAACLDAQLSRGAFLPPDWQMEALRDRAAGERAPLREMPRSRNARLSYFARRYIPERLFRLMRPE